MSIIYSNSTKNARSQVVADLLNGGYIAVGTSALAGGSGGLLAKVTFDTPSFDIAAGVMTVHNPPRTVTAIGAGDAAKAELRTAADVVVASGLTVGLTGSGADVIINAISMTVGQSVQCTLGTITPTS